MNTTATAPVSARPGWFRRAEGWLDARGKWAWIAAMVAGFLVFWPLGLGLLAYMIWGKRMFGKSCHARRFDADSARTWGRDWGSTAFRPSGNAAFDAYKADTLKRLEDEQEAFESFLQRLRESKDKKEFDSFMEERARAAGAPAEDADGRGAY